MVLFLPQRKGGKSGGKANGTRTKAQSRSARAGLQFPVGRIERLMKKRSYAQRIGGGAPGTSSSSFPPRAVAETKSEEGHVEGICHKRGSDLPITPR